VSVEEKKRLDQILVQTGLAKSRSFAQKLIEEGLVKIDGVVHRDSAEKIEGLTRDRLSVGEGGANRFVSRGGLKLDALLEDQKIDVSGMTVLDIGISTGGFTDCVLQRGASTVVGVDVGTQQLDFKLSTDPRLFFKEKVNARSLSAADFPKGAPVQFDLVVIDVSFISLELILPPAIKLMKPGAQLIALVKPQFEVGQKNLGKGGIVTDTKLFDFVSEKLHKICDTLKLSVKAYVPCALKGGDGNQEFFLVANI
jgi:23S rRNA (cytidine1920-2'-O)/16S rRNA (cytidine1409-2'-O)-methyltransferase